ncbi:MAG: NifU family protein [bacterium]|nr:NifU family protein [bacterium]
MTAASPGLEFRMHAERTPNPESIKWMISAELAPTGVTAHFREPVDTEVSPLAATLFGVPGVVGVLIGSNFVTVTKQAEPEWTDLAQPVVDAIKAFVARGEDALGPAFEAAAAGAGGEVEERIKAVIENEIRPAVAMDGGDVVFIGFEEGIVSVMLQGSCVGCPSATATLRFGIEGRLREVVPEVERVIQV